MNPDIQRKLDKLKEIYTKPVDLRRISKAEKNIRSMAHQEKLKEIPAIAEMIADANEKINHINLLLQEDRDMTNDTRKALIHERDVHYFWLKRLDGSRANDVIEATMANVDKYLEEG